MLLLNFNSKNIVREYRYLSIAQHSLLHVLLTWSIQNTLQMKINHIRIKNQMFYNVKMGNSSKTDYALKCLWNKLYKNIQQFSSQFNTNNRNLPKIKHFDVYIFVFLLYIPHNNITHWTTSLINKEVFINGCRFQPRDNVLILKEHEFPNLYIWVMFERNC